MSKYCKLKRMRTLILLSTCAVAEASHHPSWYAFYIGVPTILLLLYCMLAVWSWGTVSRRGYLSFWPLLLLALFFPPGFFILFLYIFILGFFTRPVVVNEVVVVK